MDMRNQALGILQAGMTQTMQTPVAGQIGVSPFVIHRLHSRFAQTNWAVDQPQTGHPPPITPAENHYLYVYPMT